MNTTAPNIEQLANANPFVGLLGKIYKGELITELATKSGDLIAAVKRTGTKGKLTLEIIVTPDDKGEVRTVNIDGDVKVKAPKRKKRATTFFVVGEQSLSTTGTIEDEPEFDFDAKQATALPAPITKMQLAAAVGK